MFGAAGTGKSRVRDIIASLIPCIVLGPTGMSIIDAPNGMTIARFLGIREKTLSIPELVAGFVPPANLSAHAVIVEEISMVSPKELAALDACLRSVCNRTLVCGGLRIILIGDPLQLEPVESPMFFFETDTFRNLIKSKLEVHVLSHNYRLNSSDEDTHEMAKLLADCRTGDMSQEAMALIRHVINRRKKPDNAIRLFAENADVNAYNLKRLKAFQSGDTWYAGKQYKVGAPIMVTDNFYKSDRLICANGTMGHIEHVNNAGVTIRTKAGPVYFGGKTVPLAYAWAMTITKAQGQTLPDVVVSGKNLCHPGQAYVAISRVTRLSNLYGNDLDDSNFTIPRKPALMMFQTKYQC